MARLSIKKDPRSLRDPHCAPPPVLDDYQLDDECGYQDEAEYKRSRGPRSIATEFRLPAEVELKHPVFASAAFRQMQQVETNSPDPKLMMVFRDESPVGPDRQKNGADE